MTRLPALIALLLAAGCGGGTASLESGAAASESSTGRAASPATLTLTYADGAKPLVGTETYATAEGLPPGRTVDLIWETVSGGWVIEDGVRFKGKKFTDTTRSLGQARVGADGRLAARFTIPADYGGVHSVIVSEAGVPLAQGGVEVGQTFEMHPTEGPVGTLVELRATGLGWRTMESTWVVNWDNQEIGWVSATDTRGTAIARFRAAGPVGRHEVQVYTGWMGQGYLNHEQAPNAHLPRPRFTFHVTPGATPLGGYAEAYQPQPVPPAEATTPGSAIAISPHQGPVQTRAMLTGSGLPPDTPVMVAWGTQAGSRVTDTGFAPMETELARARVGADGRLSVPITVPDDLGGVHPVSIRSGETLLARAFFVVETSVVSISPSSGPAGTPVTIHLKGVGWTDFDNIYIATYDNAYMGYACGFNSQGDVVVNFTAAGTPGVHLIDFYPGIYQGPEGGQQLYRLPQLTYAEDHPGNKIPALRFAFEVTPSPGRAAATTAARGTR